MTNDDGYGHWNDTVFRKELMIQFISSQDTRLSRLSLSMFF